MGVQLRVNAGSTQGQRDTCDSVYEEAPGLRLLSWPPFNPGSFWGPRGNQGSRCSAPPLATTKKVPVSGLYVTSDRSAGTELSAHVSTCAQGLANIKLTYIKQT
jgi:hypothetical protein